MPKRANTGPCTSLAAGYMRKQLSASHTGTSVFACSLFT